MESMISRALLSLSIVISLLSGVLSCEPEAKKPPKNTTFTYQDFENVVGIVDKFYIDRNNINKNRAFTDAAVFAISSLPNVLFLYPESYFEERANYEDSKEILEGTTSKISPSDRFVIFTPKQEALNKSLNSKTGEFKKLSDMELRKVIEKEKLRKSVLAKKWEETNFTKKDFDRVMAHIEANLASYSVPRLNVRAEETEEEGGVKAYSMESAFVAAANGYLNSLDPHSNVFMKEQWEESMAKINDGSFEGIGAILSGGDRKEVIVESPLEGSPAVKAGVRSGDVITHVDAVATYGISLAGVVKRIKGKKGTTVKLTIKRKGYTGPIEIAVVRDKITIKNVTYYLSKENPQIGVIKLTGFVKSPGEEGVDSQIAKGLRALEEEAKNNGKELKALVLDLRNNSGGYLDLAVDIADMFIEKGLIVSTGVPDRSPEESYAKLKDITKLPMAVLINSKSASASEIVASALQHHGRALVLGERSFGKATVQKLMDLPGNPDYVIKITNSRYYSPSGKTIQVVGVNPDIEISEEPDNTFPTRFREEDMWNHLPKIPYEGLAKSKFNVEAIKDYAKKSGKADSYLKSKENDAIKPDYMLIRSIDYIEGMLQSK